MTRLIALLLCLVAGQVCVSQGWAAITCSSATTAMAEPPAANPQTMAWTPSATGGIAIVAIGFDDADADQSTISSVSLSGGGSFSQLGLSRCDNCAGADMVSAIWYSTNYVGGAQTLSVTYSSTVVVGGIAAYVCTGVNTASPWRGAAATSTSNGTGSISVNVSSASGDLVIDNIYVEANGGGAMTPTLGAGQSSLFNDLTPGNNDADMQGSSEAGAGTVTMSWTPSAGTWSGATVAGSLVPRSGSRSMPIFLN